MAWFRKWKKDIDIEAHPEELVDADAFLEVSAPKVRHLNCSSSDR